MHVKYACEHFMTSIVVRCINADVIIILRSIPKILKGLYGWMLGLAENKKTRKYVDIMMKVPGVMQSNVLVLLLLDVTIHLPFCVNADLVHLIV